MYHIPLALRCIHGLYGSSDEGGENGDGEEGSEISGGWERVEMAGPVYADDSVSLANGRKTSGQ